MTDKKITKHEEMNDASGAILLFKSLPEPDNGNPCLVKKFEAAKARIRKCKLPKEMDDRMRFHITSKEFSLAPFKTWW